LRILFTTQPAPGHFLPQVALARAAMAAGHTVVVACARSFAPDVAAAGLAALPAGLDWRETTAEYSFPALRDMPPGYAANAWWVSQIFAGATAGPMAADLCAIVAATPPDLIVRDPLEFGGWLAAEHAGIPHASAGASVFAPARAWRRLAAGPLGALRHQYRLPPDPGLGSLYRYLDLTCLPPALLAHDYVAPVTHFLRATIEPAPADSPAPGWPAHLAERPLICASLGTVYNRTPGLLPAIVAALRDEPVRLVLATGPGYDAAALGELPAHIQAWPQLEYAQIFPHCALLITHGGFGTMLAALGHALPREIVPIGADQFINAQRCKACGVARVVVPEQRTPAAIRAAVYELLGQPGYRERAGALRRVIEALPAIEVGVGLLERLAAERRPLINRAAPAHGWRGRVARLLGR
jgi:UDP:flavonoid glycosyltransferase YjiC (YdhE family)